MYEYFGRDAYICMNIHIMCLECATIIVIAVVYAGMVTFYQGSGERVNESRIPGMKW